MGAGSTVFARNVLGDCMCTPSLCESEIALYDIDAERLEESYIILSAINKNTNGGKATLKTYCGVENRKEALRGADFVVNAIQVGFYDPCTIIDFEVPKKYGLRPDRLPIRWALAASCVHCAPFLFWKILPATWKKFARTHGSSITQTRWQSFPATCSAIRT